MLNNESQYEILTLNSKNQNSYLIKNLASTLFILAIPALFLRIFSKVYFRPIYYLFSSYYFGYSLRNINDELIQYGKNSIEKKN